MNRTIKFRAWNTLENRMEVYESGFSFETTKNLRSAYAIGFPIMQFTGLTDKNGKDVWEGDLMLTDDVYHDYEGGVAINALPDMKIVQVEFRDGAFFAGDELLCEFASAWEVIGNVFENPDLLKV